VKKNKCFAAWYASVPGLIVMAPATGDDFKGIIKAAIRDPNPVVVLEHELLYNESFEMSAESAGADFVTPIGKAKVELAGKDVTIVTFSRGVSLSLKVRMLNHHVVLDFFFFQGCCCVGEGRHQCRANQSAHDSPA
jgi:pyruvate/2-oxoglutarate/acetoin dehydrogenase E1 component